jgi:uncharacterized membrane protein YoaT (DUF817 family)
MNVLIGFLNFGYQQAMSCLFPVFIFIMLGVSQVVSIPYLARYDFLLVACLAICVRRGEDWSCGSSVGPTIC